MAKKERLLLLDYIRVICILMVAAGHLLQKYQNSLGGLFGIKDFYYVSIGGVGVTLLIALSGFVLEYNHGEERSTFLKFFINRLKRIYPMYWICILMAILILPDVLLKKNLGELVLDLSGFMSFSGVLWTEYILPTGWFVGLIVSLYLLFPLLSSIMKKYKYTILILLLLEVGFRLLIGSHLSFLNRPLDWFPLCRVFEFGIGIWLANRVNLIKTMSKFSIKYWDRFVFFLSSISFPFYLIHYAVQRSVLAKIDNPLVFVPTFFLVTGIISYEIFLFDERIQASFKKIIYNKDNKE